MRTTDTMVLFWRTADIYSNWHPSPFVLDSLRYANAEQYLMAAKARLFGDAKIEAAIMAVVDGHPGKIKSLGRKITGFVEERWIERREDAMFEACLAKFDQNPVMRSALIDTGTRELVEASPVDFIWGIGLAEDDPRVFDKSQWNGLNLLGEALMKTRAALQDC